ncbi:hypothetical protein WICPIJ_005253 [Wickerhamomyces pijperi]|uniref:Altered inheritance of mitochondria protein 24, mitochondrial n=1 Tax=Wickerhamomyces pijperi TaxID=599730 RepID=A0A9P8TLA6_WICPI|nr:hypothetical protein WICPIJ_005253 [Wickerhamomyces pijperi]
MSLQKLRPLALVRGLHIENTTYIKTASTKESTTTTTSSSSESLNSTDSPDLDKPEFTALGQPPTLVQIKIVPSYPVHITKGSLLSLYGTSLKNIAFTNEWLESPLKRILYGFHSFRYQKLESTAPATSLITVDKDSTLSTLSLNGTVDWAILSNDAIAGYSGATLRISTESVPRYVKAEAKKWFTLSNNTETKTGLYSFWRSGYSLVQGRGDVILKGYGSVFKVDLDADEQILIKKDNIIGISVNGDELSKCVSEHQGFNNFKPIEAAASVEEKSTEIVEVTTMMQIQQYFRLFVQYANTAYRAFTQIFPKSSDGYVNVVGPRTVLLQSDLAPSLLSQFTAVDDQTIEVLENKVFKASLQNNNKKPQDYLSYVTVKDGKVSFQSTPDFQKTIDSMPKANRD